MALITSQGSARQLWCKYFGESTMNESNALQCLAVVSMCCMLYVCCGCYVIYRSHTDKYWIGLYKLTKEQYGITKWYDGNPSTYRNWAPNEPSGPAICIRFEKQKFMDKKCTAEYLYICKKLAGNSAI